MGNGRKQQLLDEACIKLGFDKVVLAKVDKFRWTLEDRPGIGPQMIKIERLLQEATRHPIDLRLYPKKDENKRFDRNYLRGIEKL